jgi:hypothetical protein
MAAIEGATGLTSIQRGSRSAAWRAGAASLDYALVLGVMLPMLALILWVAPQIMNLAYEMICVLVSWPFQ